MRTGLADSVAQFGGQRGGQGLNAGRDLCGLIVGQRRAVGQADIGDAVHGGQFGAKPLAVCAFRQQQFLGVGVVDKLAVSNDRGHGSAP